MSLRNIRRLYTTGLTDWTKTSLRRLKKAQLLDIAQANQLKLTGTKNDIIDELLIYQDTKQNTPPPPLHKEEEHDTKYIPEEAFAENDMAEDWVKAFDMKVTQRGSSFKRSPDPNRSPPIFRPHLEKKKIETENNAIPIEKIRKQVEVSQPAQDVDPIEGMDGLWVEAFDRKVGTRGSRHQMPDTLSSKPKLSGLALEFVSFESPDSATTSEEKKIEPKVVKEEQKIEPVPSAMEEEKKKVEKSDEISHHIEKIIKSEPFVTNNEQKQQQEKQSNVMSGVIGTSMLVWYFGGGETFQKIWNLFGSSSS